MISVRLYHEKAGGHRHVRVFVGLGMAGTLVLQDDEKKDEWTPLVQSLGAGAAAGLIDLKVEDES